MNFKKRTVCVIPLFLMIASVSGAAENKEEKRSKTVIYESGKQGYHTYRIPALVVTNNGTLLAFCEGRKTSRGDHGDIDLMLRRSSDSGRTWDQQRIIHEEGDTEKITIGNPCAVVDDEHDVEYFVEIDVQALFLVASLFGLRCRCPVARVDTRM